jgi:iron complex outermembrane receptor protein
MSLEALMDIQVTSVSKRAESLSDAAAAVFVITAEDLRRSGVTTIPDALRMVPGVQVGRIDANKWAITARGFNGRFANKLLVLLDGRSVYTPLYSGVYWDVQDTLLEDVDRIEVIRGPGATLWGANAVNGVINIVTKPSRDTRGLLLSGGVGTEERGFAGARYGAAVGEAGSYRVFAKAFRRDGAVDANGDDTADDWRALRAGFRSDWAVSPRDGLTVQGDVYTGETGSTEQIPVAVPPYTLIREPETESSGGNLLARWSRELSATSRFTFQAYVDHTRRDEPALVEETRDTFDLDFQHAFAPASRHDVVWGLGYRVTRDDTEPGLTGAADPSSRTDDLFSAFFQDDIALVADRLRLILGSKVEHNDYTDWEIQPTGRLVWTPHAQHTLWSSVSRAVRTPSRGEVDGSVDLWSVPPNPPQVPLPVLVAVQPEGEFESEEVVALEVGYRFSPADNLLLDLAGFYNLYDNLRDAGLGQPTLVPDPQGPHLVQPVILDNTMDGKGYGVELAADWSPLEGWRLKAAYTYLKLDLEGAEAEILDAGEGAFFEGNIPRHAFSLRSQADLTDTVELDLWLRYVDDLPGIADPAVDDYLTLDARLGWRPTQALEVSLVGQNLLGPRHFEAVSEGGAGARASQVERGVYAKVTWKL